MKTIRHRTLGQKCLGCRRGNPLPRVLSSVLLAIVFTTIFTPTQPQVGQDHATRNPILKAFGVSGEFLPTPLYLVRTPRPLPQFDGLTVHAHKRDGYLVSGSSEAIDRLRALPSRVMPIDLDAPYPPRASRRWQRVTRPDPTIQAAVNQVSWDRLRPKIQMLQDFGTRLNCAPNRDAVRDSLANFFENLGLDVTCQAFGMPEWPPECLESTWGHNVIATQTGDLYPDSIVVICAHYDSWSENPTVYAPGADDNASGVAAVMTAAELLSKHHFAYTIQYVCFACEEYRSWGSGYFVRRASANRVNIIGALNFDMIGYWREGVDFDLEVEANEASVWLANALVNAAQLYTDTPCDTYITDIGWSDNGSFWALGYPALNNEEAWDFADPDFNPYWHNSSDLIAYVNPDFTVANTRVAVAALATVANASGTGAADGQQNGSIVGWGSQIVVESGVLDSLIAVAGGAVHSLGLKSDRTVVAWGNNESGQCNVPLPNAEFVAVSGGGEQSLGLKSDGTIVAWGDNVYGQCNVPLPNGDFVAVAAGYYHSLGLRNDGTVEAWGWNYYGQCDVPLPNRDFFATTAGYYHSLGLKSDGSIVAWGWNGFGQCDVPLPNAEFVAVAAGYYHSLGLKSDGTIVAWGRDNDGQCDVPLPNGDFVAVAAGYYHSLGLKSDGTIVAWGRDNDGQCNIPLPNGNFVAVAGGGSHSLGLKRDGMIVAWGMDGEGQCGLWPNRDFVAVAAAYYHSLGLKRDGTIVAWGSDDYGQCDVPLPNGDFVALAAGYYHSLGLKSNGTIVAWGWNGYGQCNVPSPNSDFVVVAGGGCHSLGLKSDGTIVAWGVNYSRQCDVPSPNSDFVAVAGGDSHSLGLKSNGTIVAWGRNNSGQRDVPLPNSDFVAVAAGEYHSLGLKSNGTIVAWGLSNHGQCDVPLPNSDFVAVAGAGYHSLGLKSDGTIVAWGWDGYHQCNVPPPNADFVAVAGGYRHSVGLKGSPTNCAIPEIASVDPTVVNTENCSGVCTESFTVTTGDDYSQVQKITLERSLLGMWVEQDSIGAPIGDPDWTLSCQIDGHYTDGAHTFRAVFYCEDGSKNSSFPVFVTVQRGVPVLISSFAAEHSEAGVLLRWKIAEGVGLQGFNIYKSSQQEADFERVNEQLIPTDKGNEYVDRGARAGKTYWYRLGAVADDGEWMSQTVSLTVPQPVLALRQNHPNPFNPTTTISFVLPERTRATLAIYDVEGRLVRTLVDEAVGEGYRERIWDGKDATGSPVGSGVYFYRLTAGDKALTMKMVLLK